MLQERSDLEKYLEMVIKNETLPEVDTSKYGQTVYKMKSSDRDSLIAVEDWYSQKKYYDYKKPDFDEAFMFCKFSSITHYSNFRIVLIFLKYCSNWLECELYSFSSYFLALSNRLNRQTNLVLWGHSIIS